MFGLSDIPPFLLQRGTRGKVQTFNSLFEHELSKLIKEEIEKLRDRLEVNTYENVGQFNYVMGQISAYRNVLVDLIPFANEKSDQNNR